jgi:transposase
MRGEKTNQVELFSYIPLEARIPERHPLRGLKELVDSVLAELSGKFDEIYSNTGRPSIPPETLLKASFLQVLYGIRSERLLLEQIEFNWLYRWFVGLTADASIWDETVFTKNRDRLLKGEVADLFFKEVIAIADKKKLISKDHFTADGTLIEAWASLKSLKRKDSDEQNSDDGDSGNPSVDFKGEKRSNETHESSTDPESKIYTKSKGQAAKLNYMGHVLMENRNGLAVQATVTQAGYHAEHEAALEMLEEQGGSNRKTLGGDKHYDNNKFCSELRSMDVTPHVAQNIHARKHSSAVDGRTTRHPGYEESQRKRKRVEEIFGWLKQFGPMRRIHFRGKIKIGFFFKFAVGVYNLLRIHNLTSVEA